MRYSGNQTGSWRARRGAIGAFPYRPQKTSKARASSPKFNGVLAPSPRDKWNRNGPELERRHADRRYHR